MILSTRLSSVENKVGATSNTLRNINDLVAEQARSENITIERGGKGFILDESEKTGKFEGAHNDEEGEPSVLAIRCYKGLMEASRSITTLFGSISRKIAAWVPPPNSQTPDQLGRKPPLTDSQREQLYLSERDIADMEDQIESHKMEVHISFTTFQAVL